MIILDTNVISEFGKPVPDRNALGWIDACNPADTALCAPVVAELSYGAHRVLLRDRSRRYLQALDTAIGVIVSNRVLPFDEQAGRLYGQLRASDEASGRPRQQLDLMIAAICIVNGAALATRNARDFDGLDLKVINPFEPA